MQHANGLDLDLAGEWILVAPVETIDAQNATAIRREIESLRCFGVDRIAVDLRQVDDVDRDGLQELAVFELEAAREDWRFGLAFVSDDVRRRLEDYGAEPLFEFVDAAAAEPAGRPPRWYRRTRDWRSPKNKV